MTGDQDTDDQLAFRVFVLPPLEYVYRNAVADWRDIGGDFQLEFGPKQVDEPFVCPSCHEQDGPLVEAEADATSYCVEVKCSSCGSTITDEHDEDDHDAPPKI